MSSIQIKDKAENIAPAGDEWLFAQDAASPFTVKKMSVETMGDYIADYVGFSAEVVGASIKTFSKLIPISPTFPWFCLSYPDVDFTTANYSTEFIDEMRARKYIHDEFGTPVSSFSGAWASNVFTLADTPENVAMITELAEDWLFAGSPVTNFRILSDGVTEFNITGISVTSRTITVNLDSEAATGTSVELYTNRVYRDATKARHFSEAGLATYQAGGGKSGRLRRRDQMQGFVLANPSNPTKLLRQHSNNYYADPNTFNGNVATVALVVDGGVLLIVPVNDGTNGTPRTGTETIAKSGSDYRYIYTGSYTV